MEKKLYKKENVADNRKKKSKHVSVALLVFVFLQLAVYSFLVFSAYKWYMAAWTLVSFNNLFVIASLIACGLTAIGAVIMLVGLILMLVGKGAGRSLGLTALFDTCLGAVFLCGIVVFNAITTNTAMVSMLNLYFMPTALAVVNTIAGTFFLLSSEGLKEHLAYRRRAKHEPPRPRLPETPPESSAKPLPVMVPELKTSPMNDAVEDPVSGEPVQTEHPEAPCD